MTELKFLSQHQHIEQMGFFAERPQAVYILLEFRMWHFQYLFASEEFQTITLEFVCWIEYTFILPTLPLRVWAGNNMRIVSILDSAWQRERKDMLTFLYCVDSDISLRAALKFHFITVEWYMHNWVHPYPSGISSENIWKTTAQSTTTEGIQQM